MPELDGWGFLQKFKRIKDQLIKNIDIYLISSSNHPTDVKQAESIAEVKGYFVKPVTMETLQVIVPGKHSTAGIHTPEQ